MNILAIGNSFSQDATRYLHQIAKSDGCDLTVVNLYIGGCPLSLHYKNMLSDKKAYSLEFNGSSTGFNVSMDEALLSRDWDYITLQQVSNLSNRFESYQPYLTEISKHIKTYSPKAVQLIHETWAYEENSDRLCRELGYKKQIDMYNDIHAAYKAAAESVGAKFIIPSGSLFQLLIQNNITHIHRDTFHASYGLGRYALGLLWYAMLTGNDVRENSFSEFDEVVSDEDVYTVKACVAQCAM